MCIYILSSPPSSYAVGDNSYRSMRTERKDQCILISGESGAGKTEASKKILQYYAVTCPASEQVQTVKDRLLQSNPVLEVSDEDWRHVGGRFLWWVGGRPGSACLCARPVSARWRPDVSRDLCYCPAQALQGRNCVFPLVPLT